MRALKILLMLALQLLTFLPLYLTVLFLGKPPAWMERAWIKLTEAVESESAKVINVEDYDE